MVNTSLPLYLVEGPHDTRKQEGVGCTGVSACFLFPADRLANGRWVPQIMVVVGKHFTLLLIVV